MALHLLTGSAVAKISNCWCLAARLDLMETWLKSHNAMSFSHIRRDGNKVADFVANMGVESSNTFIHGPLNIINEEAKLQECNTLLQQDAIVPDVVASRS